VVVRRGTSVRLVAPGPRRFHVDDRPAGHGELEVRLEGLALRLLVPASG
jgi:hypothetical protein